METIWNVIWICLGLVGAGVCVAVGALTERTKERDRVMAKIGELTALLAPIADGLQATVVALGEVGPQLEKAKDEIIAAMGGTDEIPAEALAKIEQLGTLAQALKDSADTLKVTSKALDDLNPDATTPEGSEAGN